MNQSVNKKVAVITGGSSGIGLAIAKRLSDEGANIVITGRTEETLKKAVMNLGENAKGIVSDVSSKASLDALYERIKAEFGRIDILVANAGGGVHAPLGKITEKQIDDQFATNVKGVVLTVQQALPLLGKGSSVIIIGSTASVDPGPNMSIYGATKAAVRNMVRSWVTELHGSGIRINIVSPGPVNTESLRAAFGENAREGLSFLTAKSPLGRIGEPEEIAAVATFLASDASGYVNGIELFADGGASQT
ncbi:SDR family NAD(P)-dependent oxidoreductase [Pantoea osteomyelitidis]|uniref:SDR family NAD(P)-dependent oxidoreductase n=1 Tax=Pantoea osteomyelitidis TaxID=3230026 RepID=A0ABW7Q2P6_9GAMM